MCADAPFATSPTSKWAAAHAAALKAGGKLLALVFPLRPQGNDSQDGPPVRSGPRFLPAGPSVTMECTTDSPLLLQYFVTPQQFESLLSDDFVLEYLGDPLEQAPHKAGKEKIMIWRRK